MQSATGPMVAALLLRYITLSAGEEAIGAMSMRILLFCVGIATLGFIAEMAVPSHWVKYLLPNERKTEK